MPPEVMDSTPNATTDGVAWMPYPIRLPDTSMHLDDRVALVVEKNLRIIELIQAGIQGHIDGPSEGTIATVRPDLLDTYSRLMQGLPDVLGLVKPKSTK